MMWHQMAGDIKLVYSTPDMEKFRLRLAKAGVEFNQKHAYNSVRYRVKTEKCSVE
jgi:hypothetical protein